MLIPTKLLFVLTVLAPTLIDASKAPKVKKNPKNIVAIADFPFGGDKFVKGNIVFSAKDGKTVQVHVDMTGLPAEGGPFFYHIHENSIPGNGNCEAAGLHFNPYDASPDCGSQKDDSRCQVGDLSGKHGWINTTCFEDKYEDPFLSLNKKSKSFIIGKSIVFHFANLTKYACSDIEPASNLRIAGLIEEYKSNNDLVDVQEFEDYEEQDYDFDEEEGLEAEVFELTEEEEQQLQTQRQLEQQLEEESSAFDDVIIQQEIEAYANHSTNLTSPSFNFTTGRLNLSNETNLTSFDYENSATSIIRFGLASAIAGVVNLFI
ncbi:superoxide dismutase [Scheffersomyces coipomensis]|uniref:superoxide dismutase n=1 Tax=Scheffersomyces coipomensis TaxID=1788519 RepID=UPI00315DA7B4